jgi:hemolysin III
MLMQIKQKRKSKPDHIPPPREEALLSATHGIGALFSLLGLVVLVTKAIDNGNNLQIVSFSIYGLTLTTLYLSSTLYHGLHTPKARKFFRVMDHSSIYLLIAGSYTPFLMVGMPGRLSWIMLIVIWGLALIGIAFKVFFIHRFLKTSVVVYVLMGWLSVIMLKEMAANIPLYGLIWLGTGGILYTVGVIFYSMKKIPYMHLVWHFFVLGGSFCHYMAVYLYLT